MSLSLGYLTTKQTQMWNLKCSGLPEAAIARQLNITRQTVHQTLTTANTKLTEALKETAKLNKIDTQKLDPDKGYLLGYSPHFKTAAFITSQQKTASKSGTNAKETAKNVAKSKPAETPCSRRLKTATFSFSTIQARFCHPNSQKH